LSTVARLLDDYRLLNDLRPVHNSCPDLGCRCGPCNILWNKLGHHRSFVPNLGVSDEIVLGDVLFEHLGDGGVVGRMDGLLDGLVLDRWDRPGLNPCPVHGYLLDFCDSPSDALLDRGRVVV